jgi:hypothetical protein
MVLANHPASARLAVHETPCHLIDPEIPSASFDFNRMPNEPIRARLSKTAFRQSSQAATTFEKVFSIGTSHSPFLSAL